MICVDINKEDTNKFMEVLLQKPAFHSLWVHSVLIDSFMYFSITRSVEKETEDEKTIYKNIAWEKVRPLMLAIILQEKPDIFKVVLQLPEKERVALDENIKGFYCNIDFKENTVRITTKVSYDMINLDKTSERRFDEMIIRLLNKCDIGFISQL